ncbi:hypothetical protein CHS0354_017539 [Potamilus streckersoni]|uniref:Arpin n=1 Tax=Potamilus streckersoni TaxID=2493646 RepID=A0AAE0TG98_9BIVA|nr:hypothetical protein CHS0354_017539 [Potamilus streckersoni]
MSRIYDNKPMRNLPLINIPLQGTWKEESYTSGDGLIVEGSVEGRSRFAVTDSSIHKVHYCLFHIRMNRIHRRKFDKTGREIESNFSATQKVSTGYLNSSYRLEAKGETDRLSPDEAMKVIEKADLTVHSKKYAPAGCASLWIREEKCDQFQIEDGDSVRVRTNGDGPIIFSIVKLDVQSSTVGHYSGGEQVGDSWTDKIMKMKSSTSADMEAQKEGVEKDEWDD